MIDDDNDYYDDDDDDDDDNDDDQVVVCFARSSELLRRRGCRIASVAVERIVLACKHDMSRHVSPCRIPQCKTPRRSRILLSCAHVCMKFKICASRSKNSQCKTILPSAKPSAKPVQNSSAKVDFNADPCTAGASRHKMCLIILH